jgi:hypothetical protein
MPDDEIKALMRQAPFSFVGTVEQLSASTMANAPIDERTAVVRVEHVLHAPPGFMGLAGQRITVQLSADADPPALGDSQAFFAEGTAFGESIAVREIGRLPVDDVEPRATAAAEAGHAGAFGDLSAQIAAEDLQAHAAEADAIVVGHVAGLARAVIHSASEHDPHWWKATVEVQHTERGDVGGDEIEVLYPGSRDVRWHQAPKPKPGETAVFLLHATEGDLHEVAPFQIEHPEDLQPLQALDTLRTQGG